MGEQIQKPKQIFAKYLPARNDLLIALEKEAKVKQIPIVGPFMGQFLAMMIQLNHAQTVLELGTATGYSAIWIGSVLKKIGGQLVTIEQNEKTAQKARSNIQKAGLASIVKVKTGLAQSVMSELDNRFDMIFMDVDKEYYLPLLPLVEKRIKNGGLLIADNTTFQDAQPFNKSIYDSDQWESLNIYGLWPQHDPAMDGICLAIRK